MFHKPITAEQAKEHRYNIWLGNPDGKAYDEEHCAAEVFRHFLYWQCSRINGHGPSNLYCIQHAKWFNIQDDA